MRNHNAGTTRRNFLKTTAATAAVGATSSLWLPSSAKAAPAQGGHLRVGLAHGATADSLDPGLLENGFEWAITFAAFNNLTEIAPDGSLVGELAESWEPNADASAWTFNIRKGVQFHDGQELTADDVIASLNYHRGEGNSSGVGPLIGDITGITAPDANTVQITLGSGNVDFAAILAGQGFLIKKASDGKIDPLDPNGTGAFRINLSNVGSETARLSRSSSF
nr:ABC transporter substrate-binding protein [Ruegeria lacuscaerulensis]